MHPILFSMGPVHIYSYGLMVAIGFIASTYLASRAAMTCGVNPEKIVDLFLCMLVSGIAGARLLYVAMNYQAYVNDFAGIFRLSDGGLSFFGGLVFALLGSILYVRINKLDFWKLGDLIAPYLALGHAFGRVGCFLNGCCFGQVTDMPWGVCFSKGTPKLHPTQLYESAALVVIFVLLRYLFNRRIFSGQVLLAYFTLYCAWRFFVEFLRADSARVFFGLTVWQLTSMGIFIISSVILTGKYKAWKRTRS